MAKKFKSLFEWCNENLKEYLLNEWDSESNNKSPKEVAYASNKKYFWKCNTGHLWESKASNRTILGRGCPYCTNQKLLVGYNDFATVHPELLNEWDYDKNGDLKPENVMSGSRKKVWWKCEMGHSYPATLNHRTSPNSTGCPKCFSGRQTSFAEQAVYYYVKQAYPDAINRYQNIFGSRFELDIFIPSINTAIEYDGEAWHKNDKIEREQRKYKLCKDHGIRLIRLREKAYNLGSDVADYGFVYDKLYEHNVLQYAILDLLKFLMFHHPLLPIDVNIGRDKNKIYKNYNKIEDESLEKKYPEIAKEWHPTKNGESKPSMFKPRSDYKVWWLCSKCGFEWETTIGHRVEGTGCPKCGINKSVSKRSLKVAKCDLNIKEIIEIYNSISEAGRVNNISISNITTVCKGNRPNAGGYFWRYVRN